MYLVNNSQVAAARRLADILGKSPFIDKDGVKEAGHIYILGNPPTKLPVIYAVIMPNGYTVDYGSYSQTSLLVDLNIPLYKGSINEKKLQYILSLFDKAVQQRRTGSAKEGDFNKDYNDDYFIQSGKTGFIFDYSPFGILGTTIDVERGYSNTLISIITKTF